MMMMDVHDNRHDDHDVDGTNDDDDDDRSTSEAPGSSCSLALFSSSTSLLMEYSLVGTMPSMGEGLLPTRHLLSNSMD